MGAMGRNEGKMILRWKKEGTFHTFRPANRIGDDDALQRFKRQFSTRARVCGRVRVRQPAKQVFDFAHARIGN